MKFIVCRQEIMIFFSSFHPNVCSMRLFVGSSSVMLMDKTLIWSDLAVNLIFLNLVPEYFEYKKSYFSDICGASSPRLEMVFCGLETKITVLTKEWVDPLYVYHEDTKTEESCNIKSVFIWNKSDPRRRWIVSNRYEMRHTDQCFYL